MIFFSNIQKYAAHRTCRFTFPNGLLFSGTALFCALLLSGCTASVHPEENTAQISDTGFCLDTVITITLNGTEDETLLADSFTLINDYENLLSRTREGSDIWNINNSGGKPVDVSEETASLIETALNYSELSDGAFDITIAPVVSLWNFSDNSGTIPNSDVLAAALAHVNYKNVQLDGTAVTLADSETAIDLGGIAKGYIADRLKDFLEEKGVKSGLIDLGGNILTIGTKPDGNSWNIGIRRPFAGSAELAATVRCKDLSIVTSGSYERYFEKNGTIFHHILDPKNGYPTENGLTSVTILSEHSTDGDALSTTCFVLGLEDGLKLAESLDGIEAMFITEDEELHFTSGFPQNE